MGAQKPRAGTDFCHSLLRGKKSERLLRSEGRPSVPAKHPPLVADKEGKFFFGLSQKKLMGMIVGWMLMGMDMGEPFVPMPMNMNEIILLK